MSYTIKTDDASLINAFRLGDSRAFDVIVEKYQKHVTYHAYGFLRNYSLAEDLTQETFIKFLEAIQKNTYSETGSAEGWMKRVVGNLCMDHFRKKSTKTTRAYSPQTFETSRHIDEMTLNNYFIDYLSDRTSTVSESDAIMAALKEKLNAKIDDLLPRLKPRQRQVVLLRFYLGFSFNQIATFTKQPFGTCLGRMHYALINIRKMLQEEKTIKPSIVSDEIIIPKTRMVEGGIVLYG